MIRVTVALALLLVASAHRVRRDANVTLAAVGPQELEEHKKIVEAMIEKFFHEWNEGNFVEHCKEIYDPNAIVIKVDGVIHKGADEVCHVYESRKDMFLKSGLAHYNVLHLIENDDLAISFGNLTFTHRDHTNPDNDITSNRRDLIVFKKTGGDMSHMKALFVGSYHLGVTHHAHVSGHTHTRRRFKRETEFQTKLEALMAKVKELLEEGKIDEYVDLVYSEKIKMFTAKGELLVGKAAVKEYYKKEKQERGLPTYLEMKYTIELGDYNVAIGAMTLTSTDGEEKQQKATFATIFHAKDDSYKAVAKANFYIHPHPDVEF